MLGKKTSNRGRNPLVWLAPQATARLSEKAPPSEKNITLASSGRDLANIVSIMRHLLVFWDDLKIGQMLVNVFSNRGRNPLIWLAPQLQELCQNKNKTSKHVKMSNLGKCSKCKHFDDKTLWKLVQLFDREGLCVEGKERPAATGEV